MAQEMDFFLSALADHDDALAFLGFTILIILHRFSMFQHVGMDQYLLIPFLVG